MEVLHKVEEMGERDGQLSVEAITVTKCGLA
jgi:hypothetical protein